jgi:hypothetical protein
MVLGINLKSLIQTFDGVKFLRILRFVDF